MRGNTEMLQSEVIAATPLTAAQTAAIDHAHLRRYTMGDLQLENEVLALFASELPRTLASLQTAATAKDWKIAAHTLKGSARTVGAWRVAAAAVDAERAIEGLTDPAGRTAVVAACERAVREAVGYIAHLTVHPSESR
jgi:HPt (histidine-containing phosphotransfer) domain-containing protein